jgi:hypothetical protein
MERSEYTQQPVINHAALILIVVVTFFSCRSSKPPGVETEIPNPYFPLKLGNTWVYRNEAKETQFLFREVTRVDAFRGRTVFIIDESRCEGGIVKSMSRWRLASVREGRIFSLAPVYGRGESLEEQEKTVCDTGLTLLFNMEALPGDEWEFDPTDYRSLDHPPALGSGFTVRCVQRGAFSLSSGTTYADCVVFRTSQHEDGVEYVFAREVGLVSVESFAPGGFHYELVVHKFLRD